MFKEARSAGFIRSLALSFAFFNIGLSQYGYAQKSIIIMSGGGGPISNHSRYYTNIDRISSLFPKDSWKRAFLVADGRDNGLNILSESKTNEIEFDRQDPHTLASDDIYLAAT